MNHQHRFRNSSYAVIIDEADQRRIQQFALHELAYYNTLIENLESRTRAFPKQVSDVSDAQIEAMCAAVQNNQLVESELVPDWLQFVSGQLLKTKVVMIPETKRLMTKGMFEFFRDQAQILKDPIQNDKLEMAYKVSAQNLSKLDAQQKRHVQIPRSQVRVQWDHANEQTLLFTPFNQKPIQIPSVNLNEREGWHMCILRQEPGRWVQPETPWLAEFRHTNNSYMIRLTDSISPNRSPR